MYYIPYFTIIYFIHFQNYLSKYGICDNCTFWQIETGETWGVEYQNIGDLANPQLLFVGTWRPTDGPTMKDELFVHIAHGFRGKLLPMVSFHVSILLSVKHKVFFERCDDILYRVYLKDKPILYS